MKRINRQKKNPVVLKMQMGLMKFKRRVDFPMWHHEHISKVASIMREYADRIEAVHGSNSMRNSDKTLYAQQLIQQMNSDVGRITPTDPRERGAERLRYMDYSGLVDENGFDELNARDDMHD